MGARNPVSNSVQDGFDLSIAWRYFGGTVEEYRDLLEPAFGRVKLAANERLIRQGELGDTLYIVLSGKLRVVDESGEGEDKLLTLKGPGEGVGEISLLTGERRTATVDAVTETRLLSLSRQDVEALAAVVPEASRVISAALRRRVLQSRLNHILILTNIFEDLREEILEELQAELELISVASGDVIMRAGDAPDALYVVMGGRLRVVSQASEEDQSYTVDTCRGQTVGEIGLITGEIRTATVFAVRDSLLARLSRSAFTKLLQKYPQAMLSQFATPIISRLRDQLSGAVIKTGAVSVITIVPVSREVPLAEFTAKFTKAFRHLGSTKHLNSVLCATQLATDNIAYLTDDDPQNERFVFWLNQQEAAHDYVVNEADYELTRWSERCIRQADLIVIVANASSSPQPCAIEAHLHSDTEDQEKNQSLVLLHDKETVLPVQTDRWLAPRKVQAHYHVRMHEATDFRRISRLLTGRGVGLVLSGGGARALAHIGVIRALEECGVPIDAIGAVSGGAIVAGLWAMGLDSAQIIDKCRRATGRIDYTLPIHALTSGHNWTKSMQKLFGEVLIEDLWRYFYCVSTNLSQSRLLVHETGSLTHAVRASTAIPGILPPVFHDGSVLVDGGLMNNLPADLMKAVPDIGQVIAVDVGGADPTQRVEPFAPFVSGWKSLWQRLSPWYSGRTAPSISEILLRSISITNSQSAQATRHIVDLYLEPPVKEFGLLDFDKIEQLASLGHENALKKIEAWRSENSASW